MIKLTSTNKTSSQKRIILTLLLVFIISTLIICLLMYQVFSKNLSDSLHTRATEVLDIIDYMAQTSGESPELVKGIKTLAANRDIKLIIVRINEPPVVIASNKEALIGLPSNEIFTDLNSSQSFTLNSNKDQYTAISSIWLENKFNNGQFTKASVGVVFDTHNIRTILKKHILDTSIYLILLTIIVFWIMYFLTNKYIFKPLESINSSLLTNNHEKEFTPIPLVNNDEIGLVANTLNELFGELFTSKRNLRESTERYDLALQGTKVGLVDWDIVNDDLYSSSTLLELLGFSKGEFKPNTRWIEENTHPDDIEIVQSALISHLKFDTEYDIEARLKCKDGNFIWVRARGRAVRDENGKAVRMVGYYVDISKRKEHENFMNSLYLLNADATISLPEKIQNILSNAAQYLNLDCGIICKIDGNASCVKYSVAPKSYDINNETVYNLHETFCSHTVETNSTIAIHDASISELKHLPEHELSGINSYLGTPIYLHGLLYGTVSFLDNKKRQNPFSAQEKSFVKLLSQWVGNEMMRAEYIDYLHETENRLETAVEELTNTNSELESFTYVASHDLQEPLRMIKNFTGLLEQNHGHEFSNEAKEYLSILSKSASQMRALIKDLLDYAHASNDNDRIDEIDLNETINHVYANLKKQIRESNAQIITQTLPIVYANKISMISLLQNLISNGIKFQRTNQHPIIKVKATQYLDSWGISISDNGIGIEDDYQNKIFEPFIRLHSKNEFKGTGIGLAVCKKIIARMDGSIWVESDKNQGSTFHITIPKVSKQTVKAA